MIELLLATTSSNWLTQHGSGTDHQIGHNWSACGNGACLIEDGALDHTRPLQTLGILDQDAAGRTYPGANHNRRWGSQPKGAWAGDH